MALVAGLWWLLFVPRYQVPMPPADATPQQVAMAYMRALDGGDQGTALALSTPDHKGEAKLWISHTAGVRDRTVTSVTADNDDDLSDWRAPGEPYTQAVQVEVNFTYQKHWWSDDDSVSNGPMLWGYFLVRVPGGRWLVSGEGVA
ncbi:hypothetical protein [Streptacidiphilus sp. PAMC 29251]